MTKNYIKNLETGKIELHFSKPEYQALSDELKKEIKSSYLFSGIAKAWVSRGIHNQYRAIQTAIKLGFTEEEKQGERLTFAEQLFEISDVQQSFFGQVGSIVETWLSVS